MSGEAVGAGLADAITTVRAELERAIAASGRSSPGTPSRRGPPRSGAELFPGNEAVEDPRIRVVEHHEPAVGAGLEPAVQPLSPDHAVLPGRSAVNLLIQSAHGRSEGEAVRGAEPPHLIGGMLPGEQPMGVLQGEGRLADAPS